MVVKEGHIAAESQSITQWSSRMLGNMWTYIRFLKSLNVTYVDTRKEKYIIKEYLGRKVYIKGWWYTQFSNKHSSIHYNIFILKYKLIWEESTTNLKYYFFFIWCFIGVRKLRGTHLNFSDVKRKSKSNLDSD